jgi:hypothetical protein
MMSFKETLSNNLRARQPYFDLMVFDLFWFVSAFSRALCSMGKLLPRAFLKQICD